MRQEKILHHINKNKTIFSKTRIYKNDENKLSEEYSKELNALHMVNYYENENTKFQAPKKKLTNFSKYIQMYKVKDINKAYSSAGFKTNVVNSKTIVPIQSTITSEPKSKNSNKRSKDHESIKLNDYKESPYKKMPHIPSVYKERASRSNSSSRIKREQEILAESHY